MLDTNCHMTSKLLRCYLFFFSFFFVCENVNILSIYVIRQWLIDFNAFHHCQTRYYMIYGFIYLFLCYYKSLSYFLLSLIPSVS